MSVSLPRGAANATTDLHITVVNQGSSVEGEGADAKREQRIMVNKMVLPVAIEVLQNKPLMSQRASMFAMNLIPEVKWTHDWHCSFCCECPINSIWRVG